MNTLTSFRRKAGQVAGAVAVGLMLALPLVTHAAAGDALKNLKGNFESTGKSAGVDTAKSLPELVGSFIQGAIGLLGIILVVLVIYAGFIWMTAQGNEEKIKKAKGMISSAVIGIIIIFAAYAITGFVVSALTTATTGSTP